MQTQQLTEQARKEDSVCTWIVTLQNKTERGDKTTLCARYVQDNRGDACERQEIQEKQGYKNNHVMTLSSNKPRGCIALFVLDLGGKRWSLQRLATVRH